MAVAGVAIGIGPEDALASAILIGAAPLMHILITLGWTRARDPSGPRLLLGSRPPTGADATIGVGGGLVGAVLITFVLGAALRWVLNEFGIETPPVQEPLRVLATGPAAPFAIFTIVVIAPVAEELFFRGMLFQAMRQRLGFWAAAVASGLVFGAVHGEPFVIVLTTAVGVFLAWLYQLRGTLLVPILAHAVFNALGVALIRAGLG
jgi:membrane protease YdiL (CAAX protease family)